LKHGLLFFFPLQMSLQGLYQKAEALYTMGDFEFALVFYHRGCELRPELQKFRLGIQKSHEAIINCIGSKKFPFVVPAGTAEAVGGVLSSAANS